jgi:hypothetical protein
MTRSFSKELVIISMILTMTACVPQVVVETEQLPEEQEELNAENTQLETTEETQTETTEETEVVATSEEETVVVTQTETTEETTTPTTTTIIAVNDQVEVNEDGVIEFRVLLNDTTEPADVELQLASFTQPVNGDLQVSSDYLFTYTPDADFNGSDAFSYVVSDSNGNTSTADVLISVASVDDVPMAENDTANTQQNGTISFNLLDNDEGVGDTIQVFIDAMPQNGAIELGDDGLVTYIPDADFFGQDSFVYRIEDADGDSATASVSLNVACLSNCGRTFQLSWEPSESPNALIYRVYVGTAPNSFDTVIEVGDTLSYDYTVSEPGDYYFAVSAVSEAQIESELVHAAVATF